MDYNKYTKLRIYLKINCMHNREVSTALLILLINVGLCQKKDATETVTGHANMKLLLLFQY